MRIRALVVAAALVAGSAATVSAAPPAPVVPNGHGPGARALSSYGGHQPLGLRAADFRNPAALRAARIRELAGLAHASGRVGLAASDPQPVYVWSDSDAALPDVNGDGVGDVLSSRRFARTPVLQVLSGRTGRALWSTSAVSTYAAVYMPGPAGKSLVLLLSDTMKDQGTPASDLAQDEFTVAALNPKTGAPVWSTSITGVIEDDPTGDRAIGAGDFAGVMMRKGSSPYLLLARLTLIGGATLSTVVVPEVVDATNGSVVRSDAPLGGDDFTFAWTIDDLDNDGTDDYLLIADGDAPTVSARSGASGLSMWSIEGTKNSWLVSLAMSPDFSGDDHADLLIGWFDLTNYASTIHAVNGSTGAEVWSAPGDYGEPLGDLDHDGRSDTQVMSETSHVTLTATSGLGKRLWSRDVTSPPGTRPAPVEAGDLDGDHVPETYVRFLPDKRGAAPTSAAIVSGRTGAVRTIADIGWPLGVSLRGGAPSFLRDVAVKNGDVLTMYDGRTHRALWHKVMKSVDEQTITYVDVVNLGHGRLGLLGLFVGRTSDRLALFDGGRGTTLWTSSYATNPDEGMLI
jgi:hypothetical protein